MISADEDRSLAFESDDILDVEPRGVDGSFISEVGTSFASSMVASAGGSRRASRACSISLS